MSLFLVVVPIVDSLKLNLLFELIDLLKLGRAKSAPQFLGFDDGANTWEGWQLLNFY